MSDNTYKRGEDGLLTHLSHPRHSDGSVDWRQLLLPEHLYVNPDYEKELLMQFGVKSRRHIDVTKVDDRKLLVLLDGWRYLLKLRGYRAINIKMDYVSNEKAAATCAIELIGNYETGGQPITISDSASASLYSVSGSFQLHLEAMAANRAFVRCVRAALGVKIYGKDEFDSDANAQYTKLLENGEGPKKLPTLAESTPIGKPSPTNLLRKIVTEKGLTFDKVKARAIEIYAQCAKDPEYAKANRLETDPSTWTDYDSMSGGDTYMILALMEKKGKK